MVPWTAKLWFHPPIALGGRAAFTFRLTAVLQNHGAGCGQRSVLAIRPTGAP